jgi:hypothetical protein
MSAAERADEDPVVEDVPGTTPGVDPVGNAGKGDETTPAEKGPANAGEPTPELDLRTPLEQSTLHITEQSKVQDHADGVRLYVTGETKVEGQKVVHKIKSDTPSKIKPKALHSNEFAVLDWEKRKHDERRRITGYERPITRAAPKPTSSGKRASVDRPASKGEALPDGTCARCGGEGAYPWSEGEWRSCPACNGTGHIGARGDEPEEFFDV